MSDTHSGFGLVVSRSDGPTMRTALYRTRDGAATWEQVSAFPEDIQSWAIQGDARLWMVVRTTHAEPWRLVVTSSADAGKTWKRVSVGAARSYQSVSLSFASPFEGTLRTRVYEGSMSSPVDAGPTFVTHDGGTTWQPGDRDTRRAWGEMQECTTCPRLLTYGDAIHPIRLPHPLRCMSKYAHVATDGEVDTMLVDQLEHDDYGDVLLAYCAELQRVSAADHLPSGAAPFRYLFVAPAAARALVFLSKVPIGDELISLRFGLFWRISGRSLIESTDAGETWHERPPPQGISIGDLRDHGARSMFVSVNDGWLYLPKRWIYRTTDGGVSFTRLAR